MKSTSPYKIVYILGPGHSGSTLIDMIIGSSKEAHSLGEMAFYGVYKDRLPHPKISTIHKYNCTCEKDFNNCPFWKNVHDKTYKTIEKSYSKLYSLGILLNLLLPFQVFHTKETSNFDIYRESFEAAKKIKPNLKYLVDSSKDPRRLYELLSDNRIKNRVRVVYPVRDGRAYVHSLSKDLRTEHGLRKYSTIESMTRWLAAHCLSLLVIRKHKPRLLKVYYKNLANEPTKQVKNIEQFLGIKIGTTLAAVLKAINKTTYHNLFGNLMRFNVIKTIYYDDSWKNNLNIFQKVVATLFLFPFLKIVLKEPVS